MRLAMEILEIDDGENKIQDYKMASSSSNNSNIRLKPRLCDCGRTTAMHIVRTNQNGNKGLVYFINKEHCNYFKFANDDDDDVISNAAPRKFIKSQEFNDLSTRAYEMDNEFQEHDRRLQRMEKKLNVVLYVIVFDGHGGKHAADFACSHLPRFIIEDEDFPKEVERAVTSAFL
ncbi:uncharacterized protein LOC114264328 [Camellia sinensis]|uniref:uncharacterized protein LOC114264328 n=1 Tax=Camellia sinensis TaxID=4442 RepID=UPI001035DF7F|nr:uncharacterized protein LOC114264328 [Camellia sinensis]